MHEIASLERRFLVGSALLVALGVPAFLLSLLTAVFIVAAAGMIAKFGFGILLEREIYLAAIPLSVVTAVALAVFAVVRRRRSSVRDRLDSLMPGRGDDLTRHVG